MDKNAIKSFAIESRRQLIESVKFQASLIGITADGIAEPISKAEGMETYDYGAGTYSIYDNDIQKRENLIKEIENKGFDNVIEEVAYTWFNRIIAIRFMEVNDYLPTRTRVLSSEIEGKAEPDIIDEALELDLDYSLDDKDLILKLKDENKLDELFRFLFVKQCNKLNEILPGLFEKTDDYLELLLNISFTDDNGIIRQLVDVIPEEDFTNQVEIMGWLYQFYNSELKDETFTNLKKRVKISKERIPAVTQLFTPDWIVKYMVENSVGRLWLEGHPNEELKNKWKYYIDEPEQDFEVSSKVDEIKYNSKKSNLDDIKIIDPCMGSGHILVYVFEILMDIYVSEGFTEQDACEAILKNNIYGLDIDKRAYQLAYFAILMKARKFNRNILNKNVVPQVCTIEESNELSNEFLDLLTSINPNIKNDLKKLKELFYNAKEYGSILKIDKLDFTTLTQSLLNIQESKGLNKFHFYPEIKLLNNIINQSHILGLKYDIVVTNPPYMGNRGMNNNLSNYLKNNYKNSKNDLSTVFMEKSFDFSKEYGFISMINIPVWMFISSYENLRKIIIDSKLIVNMLHLGRGIFGSDFGTTAFILRNNPILDYKSTFRQLFEERGNVDSVLKKEQMFFSNEKEYVIKQSKFNKIPGSPIAYWIDDNTINCFKNQKLESIGDVKQGLATADNNRFLRLWYEVNFNKIGFELSNCYESNKSKFKWFPYNKGGDYRKWYGNHEYVVNWENDGYEIKNFTNNAGKLKSRPQNTDFYFKKSISWSLLSSSYFGVRFYPKGFIFDVNGSSLFVSEKYYYYLGGFLTSKLSTLFLSILNSSMAFQVGNIKTLPVILDDSKLNIINDLVISCIKLSKNDWDNYEVSWNFNAHPLIRNNKLIEVNFNEWDEYKNNQFNLIKNNETNLNRIFSKIYGIDIECLVNDSDITLNKADYTKDIISFISYAVGCMFGRYSLDNKGIQFAGGTFDLTKYSKFIPDDDNIIPVLDTEYFDDDIVGRFVEFVKVCFGEDTLEENLVFIAGALKKKGKTSREIIRNYFLNDFFKDHLQMYNKCPIYWQFDSGKQNAFKCLIYMHRYDSTLVASIRSDYLHKTQKAIEQNMTHCEKIIANSSNKSEISKATKDKSKYIKQLDEIKVYDEALRHLATQNIEIDLDDGVKVNYAKFQNVEVSIEGEKPKKINLLKKI